ncbi:hypothetical protein OWV82_022482 [Melia azedarach]|uniref:Uncharacterized protein n=1 Tax=Melia azedarach TaxID=155640 RepID=A0ACC1WVI9_MELAZ|nr:hypothetical protein OWV82_022482 [Melia azedarach]
MARNRVEKIMITVMVLSFIFMEISVKAQRCGLSASQPPSQLHSNTPMYHPEKFKISDPTFSLQSSNQAEDHDSFATVTSGSESEGVTLKDSTQYQVFCQAPERVLERNNELKGEIARKIKEMDKLRAAIWYVLQHLTKEVDFLEQIPNTYVNNILAERNQLKDEVARRDMEIEKFKATIQKVLQDLSKVAEEIAHSSTKHEQQQPPPTPDRKVLGKRDRKESSSDLPQDNKKHKTDNPTPDTTMNERADAD